MTKQIFKIIGMHCVSCSMNIDGELEDTEGIKSANTNFAKAVSEVIYDEKKMSPENIIEVIRKVGYDAAIVR